MKRLLYLLSGLALLSCQRAGTVAAKDTPVVLISIDTLRSDHLPAYGYDKVATPAIDALRKDAILFERAYSHVPMTFPSHSSILTGLLPTHTGVRDNVGYELDAQALPYLPRLLHDAGYATGAAVSAFVMRGEIGFSQGFDFYEDDIHSRAGRGLGGVQRPGPETLQSALPWLRGVAGKPLFFFLHLYEPHAPYAPPEPYASRYPLLYDGEIAAVDQVVGDLVAELKRLGIYDRALILLFSDHGEGLGEHGEDGHGILLYRHDLQVPLLVKLPAARHAGAAVSAPARLIDLAPTVLSVLGRDIPAAMQGKSLLDLLQPEKAPRDVYAESYTPRLHFGWSELTSLIRDRFQYIQGPDPELYDLQADPGQLSNLLNQERRTFSELRRDLGPYLTPLQAPKAVDEETKKSLAALGYIGTAPADLSGTLPDPKSMLHTLADLQKGLALFAQKKPGEAVAVLRKAVDANPRMVDAWDYLGRSYQRLNRHEEALRAFKESMKLSGGTPETALGAAMTLIEVGRPDEALLVLQSQIAKSPEELRLQFLQIRLLLVMKQTAEAARLAGEVLGKAPDKADAHYAQGSVAMAQRDFPLAEQSFRRALELDPDHPASLSDLGVLLTIQGRLPEAQQLVERLVALQPQNPVAAATLAEIKKRRAAAGS